MRALSLVVLLALLGSATPTSAQAPLVTIDVHDADLNDVIALLAAESGANIVADASVKPQRVTLHLRNVSFDQALDALVSSHSLQVRRVGSILIVGEAGDMNRRYDAANTPLGPQTVILSLHNAKPDEVAKEMTDALPPGTVIVADKRTDAIVLTGDDDTIARARRLVGALDLPTSVNDQTGSTRSYPLRFAKIDDVIKQLKIAQPDGIFIADPPHNAVVVTGDTGDQRMAQGLIAKVDVAGLQVLFEVKVADITPQNDTSNFGLEFGGSDLTGAALAGGTTYAFTGGTIPVNVSLNALITNGRAQILATPKLMTLNNQEADLLIGETYPIVYNTSVLGGQNVQFVDIGVKLRLTPTIGPDGTVTAELHPEYSELEGFNSSGYPIIANRKIDSTLRVADNQTIVLGGLMRDVSSETISRVPGLSDIPVLGQFFKNKQTSRERDEIVFMITPHVIYPNAKPPTP